MSTESNSPVVFADHEVVKRLGRWTKERNFDVRARRSTVVLDLRSPEIGDGDITVNVDLDGANLEVLVAEDAEIDQTGIAWTGRGRVKDAVGGAGGRRVVFAGPATGSEVRVKRGGVAVLTAMASREFIEDVKHAHRTGGNTTVDDPNRDPYQNRHPSDQGGGEGS